MHLAASLRRRQMSAGRQFAIGAFGFFDARRRCAEHECNARAAIFRDGRSCAIDETVLMQRDPRQTVVAAVPCGEEQRQRRFFNPSTRPIQQYNGCAPKSLGRNPLVRDDSALTSALTPRPAAQVAV